MRPTDRLRVASLNVWGLHDWIVRDAPTRMDAIGEALGRIDADLVAFQEVWTRAGADALAAGGARAGLSEGWRPENPFEGGGLLVLTRRPIHDAVFHPFRVRGRPERVDHMDYWAGKGFVTLEVGAGDRRLQVVATHLHAEYAHDVGGGYHAVQVAQLVDLAVGVRDRSRPLVLVGDLNIAAGGGRYDLWVGLSGARDAALESGNPLPTVLDDNPYRSPPAESERIDYVYLRDGDEVGIEAQSVAREFDAALDLDGRAGAYSDHAGLVADLALGDVGRPPPAPDPIALEQARRWLERGRQGLRRRRRVQRSLAGGATSLALASAAAGLTRRVRRRTLLRGLAGGGLALGLAGSGGLAWIAERDIPRELAAFDAVERGLLGLEAGPGPGPA